MTTINLKDFYYWYTQDQFIEVSDEVAEVFMSDARHEMAYQRRLSRHKAQYSLDCDDGIEYSACLHEPTPQELLERMELFIRLWNALNSLPEIQGRRIDAHIILGKSIKEIAEAEGVHEESVRQSIKRGLERHEKNFLIFSFSPLGNDEKMSRFMKGDILLSADKQRRPPGIVRGAGRRVRCDFFFGRTSEQHQRRNWAGPSHGHDPA